MLGKEEDDWCIVRWRDGDVLFRRKSQWEPHANRYLSKWKYIAEGLTEKQAAEYSKLFKGEPNDNTN
jgi:hypothetical protein